jgi:hypothetical protein
VSTTTTASEAAARLRRDLRPALHATGDALAELDELAACLHALVNGGARGGSVEAAAIRTIDDATLGRFTYATDAVEHDLEAMTKNVHEIKSMILDLYRARLDPASLAGEDEEELDEEGRDDG